MWFKNLRALRLTSPFALSAEQLHEQMLAQTFTPCSKTQAVSSGWVPPLGGDAELLVHSANGKHLVCMRREERLLPANVVREMVDERVAKLEQAEGRKVRRREKEAFKDEIILDALPRAFTRSTRTFGLIDAQAGWIFVDSGSAGRAEELTNLLRESVGSFPLLLPEVNHAPSAVMTSWLQHGNLPGDMHLGDECELRDLAEDGGIVRLRRQDLTGEEVHVHLEAGKRCVRLGLTWQDQVSLVLGEDLTLKRLRFDDEMTTRNEDIDSEDAAARFDADFALMTEVLTPLFVGLLEHFGGELRDG